MTPINRLTGKGTRLVLLLVWSSLSAVTGCGEPDGGAGGSDTHEPVEVQLLKAFQPILVQEVSEDYQALPYPPTSDLIGKISLHEDPEGRKYAARVGTDTPVMYALARTATIHGMDYHQLVYAFFYPERPIPVTLEDNPLEYVSRYIWSGPIDGKVIRITLDETDRFPLFVEVVQNCGCTWQFHVNKRVDNAARAQFEEEGLDYPGLVKPDAPHDVQYVWIMPENVEGARTRIVVVAEDGWGISSHHPVGVFNSYEQWLSSGLQVPRGMLYLPADLNGQITSPGSLNVEPFSLLDYRVLYSMAPEGSETEIGIFDQYRHVWNAYNPFSELLRALGLSAKFPGTPKDAAFLEVVHETLDFWETSLYDTFIHMPRSLFDSDSNG